MRYVKTDYVPWWQWSPHWSWSVCKIVMKWFFLSSTDQNFQNQNLSVWINSLEDSGHGSASVVTRSRRQLNVASNLTSKGNTLEKECPTVPPPTEKRRAVKYHWMVGGSKAKRENTFFLSLFLETQPEVKRSLNQAMFGFLYSWFAGQWGQNISCTKI